MTAIGGYFEIADREEGRLLHNGGTFLNTGRNALEHILLNLGPVDMVWLPYYTCDVVLEPLVRLGIPYAFYQIDRNLEIASDIPVKDGEYLIANNYFGLKDAYLAVLAEKYGRHLIADCSQALFAEPLEGSCSFYSFRKFVGVADGGIAFVPGGNVPTGLPEEPTSTHDSHLYVRKQYGAEAGFKDFQANESLLDGQPVRAISSKTLDILEHIDFGKVAARRVENFSVLHEALGSSNQLECVSGWEGTVPMVYPFLVPDGAALRERLIAEKIFCARYWPNVLEWCGEGTAEYDLALNLVAIPCDQRYGIAEMQRMIEMIKN